MTVFFFMNMEIRMSKVRPNFRVDRVTSIEQFIVFGLRSEQGVIKFFLPQERDFNQ